LDTRRYSNDTVLLQQHTNSIPGSLPSPSVAGGWQTHQLRHAGLSIMKLAALHRCVKRAQIAVLHHQLHLQAGRWHEALSMPSQLQGSHKSVSCYYSSIAA
jgi:hypothetical protein